MLQNQAQLALEILLLENIVVIFLFNVNHLFCYYSGDLLHMLIVCFCFVGSEVASSGYIISSRLKYLLLYVGSSGFAFLA